jgi:FG-GAP repeat protein
MIEKGCGMKRFFRLALTLAAVTGSPASGQIYRLPLADTTRGNFFGAAVAIDQDQILIGSTGYDSCGPNSGAAFIYQRGTDGMWADAARLEAEDCQPGEYFGRAVALKSDIALVTSFIPSFRSVRSNAVYVFERNNAGDWVQTGRLTGPGGRKDGPFGASVSVDDSRILVTSAGDTAEGRFGGSAAIYERGNTNRWTRTATLRVTHDARQGVFGTSSILEGTRAIVTSSTYGRNSPGSAFVFELEDGNWKQTARLDGVDDYFIPIDLDGDRLIVGQTRDGQNHTGRAVIYEIVEGRWRRTVELKPDSPYPSGGFGSDVALSGDIAIVVGFDEQLKLEFNIDRVVFVFGRDPETGKWTQKQIVDVGETYFGSSVDVDGRTAVIGQASEDAPGTVYIATLRR